MSYTKVESGGMSWNFHTLLKENLDVFKRNIQNDWDVKILVSGDGMTRTSKTTIACQSAQYMDDSFAKNWRDRIVFDGQKLRAAGLKAGKMASMVYDEAARGLSVKDTMAKMSKSLVAFFNECGDLNLTIFIVMQIGRAHV